jgi:AraC-like DNA-binding protein
MDKVKKQQKIKDVFLIPRIFSTGVSPIDEEIIRPGKPCDDKTAIKDEMHLGGGVYCPRLLFNVILSNMSSWCPGTSIERKNPVVMILSLVTSGKGRLIADDRKYELEPNDVYFLHPDEKHILRALPPDRFCRRVLSFHGGFIHEIIKQMGLRDVSRVRLSKDKADHVDREFKAIDKLICEKPEDFRTEISGKLFLLLLFLANEVYGKPEKKEVPECIEKCMNYVVENLDKPLQLSDLARASHTSIRNLNRIFLQFIGVSPHQWLEVLKMNLSALDLTNTLLKVHVIAEKYGFSDQFHYSHSFKRAFGMSPMRYRQLSRGDVREKG